MESVESVKETSISKMYCSAVTKQNTPCLNKCDGKYCHVHKRKKYNECMICYEDSTCEAVLSCGHSMCVKCSLKCDIKCPMCRQETNTNGAEMYGIELNAQLSSKMIYAMSKRGDEKIKLFHDVFKFTIENRHYFLKFDSLRKCIKDKLEEFKGSFDCERYIKQIEAYEDKLV